MYEISMADRPAIVTGASRGIGRAIVARFAEAGGDVVICARDIARVEPVAEEITDEHPGRVVPVGCDVTQTDEVEAMVNTAVEVFGGLKVLVNNAGGSFDDDLLHRVGDDTLDQNIDVNLKGQLKVARAALPAMVDSDGGSMIHMSSVNGIHGIGLDTYSAAKGGIFSFSRNLATHYGHYGVRSNVLSPGTIETKNREDEMEEIEQRQGDETTARDRWLAQYPLCRFGRPDEVADATLFLASEMSSFVNGTNLVVDGGLVSGLDADFQQQIYQTDDRPTRK